MSKNKIKDYKLGMEEQEVKDYIGKRRIPIGDYLKLKKSSLLLYIHLQQISKWTKGEHHRYIFKEEFSVSNASRTTGLSRNTINAKLKVLNEVGMIKYWSNDSGVEYILLPDIGDYYVLVDTSLKFVRAILELCDEVLLRVYLFHKSHGRTQHTYSYTLDKIAEEIGYCANNRDRISKANAVLEGFNVIKITKKQLITKTGKTYINQYTYLKEN